MFFFFFNVTTIEKFSFHIDNVRMIGSTECGNTKNDSSQENTRKNDLKLRKYYAENSVK